MSPEPTKPSKPVVEPENNGPSDAKPVPKPKPKPHDEGAGGLAHTGAENVGWTC